MAELRLEPLARLAALRGKDFAWIGGPAGVTLRAVLVLAVSALLFRAGRSGEATA
jgi:hypothetical protein